MPSLISTRRLNLLATLLLTCIALAPAPAATAADVPESRPQQNLLIARAQPAAVPAPDDSHASPELIRPRGYDPYYFVPAAATPTHATTPAGHPSRTSIAISIAITLTILVAIAAHVHRTRVRRRRAPHALA